MIKYLGMYLLAGFVIQITTFVVVFVWSGVKLKWNMELLDETQECIIKLKMQLYCEESGNAAIDAYKHFMRNMSSNQSLAYYGLSFALWPFGFFENMTIMPDYIKYVNQKKTSSQ